MKELIVATTNQGKVKEIQAMLKDLNIEVKSLKDVYDDVPDIVEDGKTFKENALIKAKYVADDLHKIVLADDSGIEIDAFGKLPGIYSARFLGKDTPYPIINQAIIDAIEGKERTCRFVCALDNEHEGSQARLLKYESILLLVLRLLYLQKRESLAASADQVLVTVEEVQTELQKMNLPRRLDQRTLEELMRTLRRYNLARPVGRLTGLDSRIEVFPTVLLALPDADLADAAAESSRTREELALYERPEGDASGEEEE